MSKTVLAGLGWELELYQPYLAGDRTAGWDPDRLGGAWPGT
jgi:hypothetical protein